MGENIDVVKAIETVQNFLELLTTIDKTYDALYDEVGKADREQQDLLHDIEFSTFCGRDGFKKAKDIQALRIRRREVKNTMEIIGPLREYLRNHQKTKIDLHRIVQQMQLIKRDQGERIYIPRVRNDLKIANQHFAPNQSAG
jgi:hypothetical protein